MNVLDLCKKITRGKVTLESGLIFIAIPKLASVVLAMGDDHNDGGFNVDFHFLLKKRNGHLIRAEDVPPCIFSMPYGLCWGESTKLTLLATGKDLNLTWQFKMFVPMTSESPLWPLLGYRLQSALDTVRENQSHIQSLMEYQRDWNRRNRPSRRDHA